MEKFNEWKKDLISYFEGFSKASADTFAWISVVVLLGATVPGFLAVMAKVTDKMPPLDITLMLWTGLLLYFIRSAILKDMLMVVTIGLGFAIQAILLGLIFFI
jgi:hypothetical protein